MKHIPVSTAALLALTVAPAAMADVSFNGFGQVVAGMASDDDKPVNGLDYDGDVGFDAESLLALQATAPITEKADAVAQIVARGSDEFEPEFAWAYLRYRVSSNWTAIAGRQRLPYFMKSEYLEVGAAYPSLRLPLGVYNIPFSNYNGVNLTGDYLLGDWNLQTQLLYGAVKESLNTGTDIEIKNNAGIVVQAAYDDWLTMRASYIVNQSTARTAALQPLIDGMVQSGNQAAADAFAFEEDDASFLSFGAEISRGNATVAAEYVDISLGDNFIGEQQNVAISASYRIGRWTPNVSWSRSTYEPSTKSLDLLTSAHPLYVPVAGVIASFDGDRTYTSAGLRYDLSAGVALKADYTKYDTTMPGDEDSDVVSAGVVFTY